jgi:phospholipase C
MSIQNIKTVVLCMFENRSFDNMLGHLSYEGIINDANGLTAPLDKAAYANPYQGKPYYPFHRPTDDQLQTDLPHEYDQVATQLAANASGPTNTGFVQAYAELTKQPPTASPDPMCFYGSDQVPITSWLAKTFCTCDRWFCPLPTSTQPNRTVAFCGHSEIFETKLQALPADNNIFEWLNKNKITWGVYHDGFTFFALYPDLWPHIFGGNFHDYEQLGTDIKNNKQPQVIIVEPSYQDAPHVGPDHPNDNHPPLAVGWGEDFLRRTYQSVTMNPQVWSQSLMIVYNDEHGGFYDHVPPPAFDNVAAGNAAPPKPYAFNTLGPRIPGILVSPWVAPGKVDHELHDHTSVLQLLAEIFTPGQPYSAQVANRAGQGIKSLSAALTDTAASAALAGAPASTALSARTSTPAQAPSLTAKSAISAAPAVAPAVVPAPAPAVVPAVAPPPAPPAAPIFAKSLLGDTIANAPESGMGRSLENAALNMIQQHPDKVDAQFPLLNNWKTAVLQARPDSIPQELK